MRHDPVSGAASVFGRLTKLQCREESAQFVVLRGGGGERVVGGRLMGAG